LAALLLDRQVLTHPWATGEIALGNLSNRVGSSGAGHLSQAAGATDAELRTLIDRHRLYGRGIGYVDAQLAGGDDAHVRFPLVESRQAAGSDRRRTRNRARPGASAVVDRRRRSLRLAIAPPVPVTGLTEPRAPPGDIVERDVQRS